MSRWAGKGGSSRTIQRFFATVIPWGLLFWGFFRQHVYRAAEVYLLVGDEVVATKAGKHTHGLDRFFSSLYSKPVPGLAFFTLSLVSTQQRRSFPSRVEQVVRSVQKKRPARPKRPPRSPRPRAPSVGLGGPRAARTNPKPT
jgi:putative transposase